MPSTPDPRSRGETAHIKLAVIPPPQPETRAVFVWTGSLEDFKGFFGGEFGSPMMDCGKCERTLVAGVKSHQISNLVMRCPQCGTFNETVD